MTTETCIESDWGRNEDGYGRKRINGRVALAHRDAWASEHGPIPPGLVVMHVCDNPPCVNIDHLRLGTRADNNSDRSRKGRSYRGPLTGRRPSGTANGRAKFTWDDVAAIRRRHTEGESSRHIARTLGVHPSTVQMIVSGRHWRLDERPAETVR